MSEQNKNASENKSRSQQQVNQPPVRPVNGDWTSPIRELGTGGLFLLQAFSHLRMNARQCGEILRQIYFVGTRSLVIIMTSGFFVGMVLALQMFDTLSKFGATQTVGAVLALSLFRELGPVLTALLFAGRAGTSMAAEIGLMKATEQLDAMELMAIDPVERIVLPRLVAGFLAVPVLVVIFEMMALLGGYLFSVTWMQLEPGVFWGNMQSIVSLKSDFFAGMIKAVVFGGLCSLVAVHFGYHSRPTGEGVGNATTQTVIVSSILVLIIDFVLTAFLI